MIVMEVPLSVREYFDSRNAFDIERTLAQFENEAVVEDEELEFRGRDSIRDWIEGTQTKYHPSFDVTAVKQERHAIVVATLVSGAFEGSPLPIDHAFTLSNGKIGRLVIG